MSDITVTKLQDVLNDIERNAYEGILGSEEITRAYVLAGELGETIKKLKAENAKLRKIAADIHKALFSLDIDHCQACPRDTINGPCTKYSVFGDDECSIEKDMRELGMERDT